MARESFAHVGSGTVPFVGPWYPQLSGVFPQGRYPTEYVDGILSQRQGTNSVVVNFADTSVFLGIKTTQMSIGGAATLLTPSPLENRRALAICNIGPGILYIGDSPSVTTADGFPLFVNDKIAIDAQGNENVSIYGISDSTSDVRKLELA